MGIGSDLLLKLIIAAEDKTGNAVRSTRAGIESISSTAEKVWRSAQTYLNFKIAIDGAKQLESAIAKVLETGGQFEKFGASLENLMGGPDKGKAAFGWIQQFAKDTPFELEDVTKAFMRMKAFGLDPMDGSMKSIASMTSKLGGGQEELEGIVLALGQAWTKQKLEAQDANQLLERGVPVWDMLAKMMGKSSAEIMALSEAGKIGRKEIKGLIDEMGRSSSGALEAQMKTWNGMLSNVKDNWTQFLNTIAQSGVMDYFKGELKRINDAFESMGQTGELKAKAQAIANFFVGAGKAAAAVVTFITDHSATLSRLVEGLAAIYATKLTQGVLAYGKATFDAGKAAVEAANKAKTAAVEQVAAQAKVGDATAAVAEKASLATKAMRGVGWIVNNAGLIVTAIMSLKFAWDENKQAVDDYYKRQKLVKEGLSDVDQAHAELRDKIQKTIEKNKEYADTELKNAEQTSQLTKGQALDYIKALDGAQKYQAAISAQDRLIGEMDGMNLADRKALAYGKTLDEVRGKLASLHDAALPAGKFDDTALNAMVQKLKALGDGTRESKKAWDEYSKDLTDTDVTKLLESAVQKLNAAKIATGEASAETKQWQMALDGALRISLTRAGIDAEQALTGVSTEVRNSITELSRLQSQLSASGMDAQKAGGIIVAAFSKIIDKAKTFDDLQALRSQLESLGKGVEQSTPLYKQLAAAIAQINEQQAKLKPTANELEIALRKARDSADALTLRYINGTASAEDFAKANKDAAEAANMVAASADNAAKATATLSDAQLVAESVNGEKSQHNAMMQAAQSQADDGDWISKFRAKAPGTYSTGGPLPGYGGGDKIPLLAEAGEYMIRKESVQNYGVDFFNRLNANRFATGGLVGADSQDSKAAFDKILDPTMNEIFNGIFTAMAAMQSGGIAAPGFNATKEISQRLALIRRSLQNAPADLRDSLQQEAVGRAKAFLQQAKDSMAWDAQALKQPGNLAPVGAGLQTGQLWLSAAQHAMEQLAAPISSGTTAKSTGSTNPAPFNGPINGSLPGSNISHVVQIDITDNGKKSTLYTPTGDADNIIAMLRRAKGASA